MAIYYKLAGKVIDNAISYAKRGIDSLVGKNFERPAYAFALSGSSQEVGPNNELYRKRAELPSIDARVRTHYSTPDVQTSHLPTAKEVLYRLLNFF